MDATKTDDLADLILHEEAAVVLGVARQTLYTLRKEIPHYKRGRRLYFSRQGIADYIRSGKSPSHDEQPV